MTSTAVLRQRNSFNPRDRMSMRRVIIKQSYLTKLANAAKVGATFKSPHRRWFVFGVMNASDPYLEYYENEDSVLQGSPINMFFLDSCKKIYKKRSSGRNRYIFTLVLRDRELTLVADNRALMDNWCTAISQKLMSLGVFVDDDSDHVYVQNPVSRPLSRDQRDRFYPNRPAHVVSSDRGYNGNTDSPAMEVEEDTEGLINTTLQTVPEEGAGTTGAPAYEESRTNGDAAMENSYCVPANERNGFTPNGVSLETPPVSPAPLVMFGDTVATPVLPETPSTPPMSPVPPTTPLSPTDSIYQNFPSLQPLSPGLSPPVVSDNFEPNLLLTPKVCEASGVQDAVVGWNMPPPDADAPPLYLPQAALERNANRALKHSQVEEVMAEKDNPGGVRVTLKKIDCQYAIALVDCFNAVWIAGWNQAARPRLYSVFHIGDQLVSVNGQVIENAKMAHKLIKSCRDDDQMTLIIKRVPHARALAIKRSEVGQDLGIQRRDGTAEILDVDELGLAAEAGLSKRSMSLAGDDFCNWWITEVNNRPLNLFFKDDEIEKRLNAVGKDISIMVQPIHFITEMKRKLKQYRNFKDFLLH